jgi:hypothetical protein
VQRVACAGFTGILHADLVATYAEHARIAIAPYLNQLVRYGRGGGGYKRRLTTA